MSVSTWTLSAEEIKGLRKAHAPRAGNVCSACSESFPCPMIVALDTLGSVIAEARAERQERNRVARELADRHDNAINIHEERVEHVRRELVADADYQHLLAERDRAVDEATELHQQLHTVRGELQTAVSRQGIAEEKLRRAEGEVARLREATEHTQFSPKLRQWMLIGLQAEEAYSFAPGDSDQMSTLLRAMDEQDKALTRVIGTVILSLLPQQSRRLLRCLLFGEEAPLVRPLD